MKMKISDLTPYEKNSRSHSEAQLLKLEKSLQRFKQVKPILIWGERNQIVAGHGVWEAMKRLGWDECEVERVDHLSEVEMRAYVIADNKLASESTWIDEYLKSELYELADLNFDIDLTGFNLDDVVKNILEDEGFADKEQETEQIKGGAEGESIYDTESSREEPADPKPGIPYDPRTDDDVPNFEPATEEEQGRLDMKKLKKCPSCGHEF